MAFELIAIGTSLGGFQALKTVLGSLPADFSVPIAVVQHRSSDDTGPLSVLLASYVPLPVVEVDDKEPIQERRVYIGPSNYHLMVEDRHFALSSDEPVLHARPSIDVFFESVADAFAENAIGVLLTGMSKDGAAGLKKMKEAGGRVVVQNPAEAEGQIMPQAAIDSVMVDKILGLEEIAPFLTGLCAARRTESS